MHIIRTNFGAFNVYINRLSAPDENIVHVSFVDHNNKTHAIEMQYSTDRWVVRHPETVPGWFNDFETKLDSVITEQLAREYHSSLQG